MDKIKAQLKEHTAVFDQWGDKVAPLKKAANDQGLNSGSFVAVGIFVFSVFMLLFHGVELAITGYTILYPAMKSVRAIESKNADDDKHWLSYWMVVGVLEVLETFFGFIFWIIPFWRYIRVVMFVYLISFGGSTKVFMMLKPFLESHKEDIQNFIKEASAVASDLGDEAKKSA